jgi:hypothetical protein
MLRSRPLPRLLVLTLPLAALVSAATANAGSKQQLYAVGKPVCKAPKHLLTAHQATCTALRRVLVRLEQLQASFRHRVRYRPRASPSLPP